MRNIRHHFLALTTILAAIMTSSVFACTGIQLKSQDNAYVSGRTLEFGIPINTVIDIIPRNYAFTGTLPDGSSGMKYKSKYGAVGGSLDNGVEVQDGMNEAGLSVGAFYFPGYAGYAAVTSKNKNKALSPLQFPTWILTQFATIDQVKAALNNVAIVPTVYQAWGLVPPLHYIVYDKTGASIVIEPLNGKLVVYNNPMGVFTNSPTFDWHMTNLRNYINLSPINVSPVAVSGMELSQFSQGSGMHGLPGDFTSPSRFVRAAFYTATAIPAPNASQEVLNVFHILNQFDIPMGAVRDVQNGKMAPEYTMITIVRDPQNLDYYFKSYQNQSINVIHLSSFDLNAPNIKYIMTDGPQVVTDAGPTATDTMPSAPAAPNS
jgi:choloylglycine hydrolase